MKKRVLVTGGAGFIGGHLVDLLVSRGNAVTVLDDFSTGELENLAEARRRGNVRVITGSVLDPRALQIAMADCDRVFHLAVQCVRRSLRQPVQNHEINATGTLLTLEAARQARVNRFVYCSSSEVYGNCRDKLLNEEATLCAPVTVYGASKLAGELYASAYHQTYGLPAIIVRPFNAYGPREHESGDLAEVVPRFIIRLLSGKAPVIFGGGENGRDFTYVTETALGIVLASEADKLIGRTVNIARGEIVTIGDLAKATAVACGRPDIAAVHIEARPGDVVSLHADTRLAENVLHFRAQIALAEGLEKYVAWFRTRHNDVASLLEPEPRNW